MTLHSPYARTPLGCWISSESHWLTRPGQVRASSGQNLYMFVGLPSLYTGGSVSLSIWVKRAGPIPTGKAGNIHYGLVKSRFRHLPTSISIGDTAVFSPSDVCTPMTLLSSHGRAFLSTFFVGLWPTLLFQLSPLKLFLRSVSCRHIPTGQFLSILTRSKPAPVVTTETRFCSQELYWAYFTGKMCFSC